MPLGICLPLSLSYTSFYMWFYFEDKLPPHGRNETISSTVFTSAPFHPVQSSLAWSLKHSNLRKTTLTGSTYTTYQLPAPQDCHNRTTQRRRGRIQKQKRILVYNLRQKVLYCALGLICRSEKHLSLRFLAQSLYSGTKPSF